MLYSLTKINSNRFVQICSRKMISYLANVVNILAATIQTTILLTSYVGQVIVLFITTIVSIIYKTVESVVIFLQIVYEDNRRIFTDELPSVTNSIIDAVWLQLANLQTFFLLLCYEVYSQITTMFSSVHASFEAVFIVISEVFYLLKKTVIFLGDSFWFLLTFVPVHLPCLIKTIFLSAIESIVNIIIDFYMSLLRITNFLSDVPLESFLGIILAMIVTRLCITFREVVYSQVIEFYWICVRKVMFLYYHIYNYFIDTEGRVIAQITGGHTISPREVDDIIDETSNGADSLCVICQERQKCVLILPCRHVCLCSECCMRLYGYQRTCPICRTFIYHSVTIYL